MTDNWSTEYKQALVGELNELRESLAECQHVNDKLRESARLHRRRANELVKRVQDLERLLESLTPGGSEFASDPQSCARWARDRLASVGKLAAERNRYQGQAAALAEALQTVYDDITAKNFSRTTFGEYREGALIGDCAVERAKVALEAWKEATDE
jgi:DNA repair exonuclease SbcCD ATPase subunit